MADVSEQKDKNSGFELKQQTVAVTVFSKPERGKSETLLKSELKFCTVSVDCSEVFVLYLPYLSVQNTFESCSNLSAKVSLDINSFEDSLLEEINSEIELREFMTTLGFTEEEERFSQFKLKLESPELLAFSGKSGLEIEAELEFCTILTNFCE